MLRHELRLAAAFLAVGLAACGDLSHQNPFDPKTPAALQARATVSGLVSLEAIDAGEPALAGVLVSIPGTGLSAVTDADGRYVLQGVGPGAWSVQATKDKYRPAVLSGVTVSIDDGNKVLAVPDLVLQAARGDLLGTVALSLEAGGRREDSAAGVAVALNGRDGAVFSDAAGTYQFTGVPVGQYLVVASKTGFKGQTSLGVATVVDGLVTVFEELLVLPPDPGTLRGSVLVLGAADSFDVTVRARGATLSGTFVEITTASAADGSWAISPIPAGSYNVSFEKADYATATTSATVVPAEVTDLANVTLQRDTGSVIGTALLQGAGDHAGVQVTLTPAPTAADPTPSPAAAAITDAAGSWRADLLPVGDYSVRYRKQPGYQDQVGTARVVSHQVTQAPTATLPAIPGLIQGRALLEGAAAAGHAGTLVRLENTTISTFTAADGGYELSGVGAGAQVVVMTRAGHDEQRVQAVVGPGETISLFDVTLPVSRGGLAGRFTLTGAPSSAGVVVSVTGAASATTVTDDVGQFALSGLPVGTYAVTARREPDWQAVTVASVTVAPGAVAALPGSPVALQPVATASIAGTVLAEGAPADGTTVTLTGQDFRGQAVSLSFTTGLPGAWSFAGLAAGSYQVSFARAGFESPAPLGVALSTGQGYATGAVTLSRSRGAIAGAFALTGAGSSAGVVVSLQGTAFSTVTDAAGAFTLSGVPVGTYVVLAARPPDWVPAAVPGVEVTRDQVTALPGSPVGLVPVGTSSVGGVALVEGGLPAGTTVSLTGQDFRGSAVSTGAVVLDTGLWRIQDLPAGSYQVTFSRAGFEPPAPIGVALGTGQAFDTGSVTLARSRGTLTGSFALAGAGSSAGVVVTLQGTAFSTVTDAAGAFTLTGVPVGTYVVLAAKPPEWTAGTVAGAVVARGAVGDMPGSPVTLQPVSTASISGTVTAEGADAAGTTVDLTGQDFRGVAVSRSLQTTTSGWQFSGLAAGSYQVAFRRTGFESPAPLGVALSTGQVYAAGATALALSRGTASGVFTLADAGSSAGVVVTLQGTTFSTVTDAAGAFSLAGVPVGTYVVLAAKPPDWIAATVGGLQVTRDAPALLPGSPVTLQPVATASVAGTVTAEGASDAGTTVNLSGQDFRGQPVSRSAPTVTSAWSFGGLPAGSYQVTFARAGFEAPAPIGVALSTGQAYAAGATALALSRGGVSGVFTLASAASSSGVVVSLQGTTYSTVTDASGAFTLTGVPVGSYALVAGKPTDWQGTGLIPVTVARNETRDFTGSPMTLQPVRTASISGTVQAENGGADGTTVNLTGQDFRGQPVSDTLLTTATGTWSFSGLPAGSYQVAFVRSGWESPAPLGVALGTAQAFAAGGTTLAQSRGGVRGTFTLESAASSAGVIVSLQGTTFSTVTDAAGAFTLGDVPVGSYTLVASKPPDWAAATPVAVTVAAGATTLFTGSPVTLQPVRTASIGGTVLAENGVATGTTVNLTGQDFRGQAVTATFLTTATGAWSFATLPAGSYQVAFVRSGWESPASIGVALGTAQAFAAGSTTLAQSRGGVSGLFTLAGAASAAGVVVSLQGTTFSTVTDGTGAFTLTDVPVGGYTLVAAKPPDWQASAPIAVTVARGAPAAFTGSPVALQPVATASIGGVALGEGLSDHSGTTVTLDGVDFRGVAVHLTASTSAVGVWSIGALRAGSYQVTFGHAAFDAPAPAGVSVVTGQAASLGTITLAASRGTVAGTVTATGAGAQAGTVVTVSGGPDTASTVTNAAGAWRIDGLRVGTGYQATFSRPAYVTRSSATLTVLASTTVPVADATLLLDDTGRISGVARLERPAAGPHGGTLVSLAGFDVNGAAVTTSTTTAADGSYQLSGLVEGTYGLSFSKTRYDAAAVGGLFVAAGAQVTAASVVLPVAKAVVAGAVVLDPGAVTGFDVGTDRSGIVVTLSGTDVPVSPVVTDAAGSYRFTDVPVSLTGGSFFVSAGRTYFDGGAQPVTAAADATTTAPTITLFLLDGSLTGAVLLSDNFKGNGDNLDHTGTQVDVSGTAFNNVAFTRTVFTDGKGAWDSGPLPPGSYDLTATSTDRTCELYKRTVVEPKLVNDQGPIRCFDALAPTSPTLGDPVAPPNAEVGYTNALSVVVPITTQSDDLTVPDNNFRGYEVTRGAAPDWGRATLVEGQPANLTFGGLAPNARNVLWARAVDWLGNASTATSAEVITDSLAPPIPVIATPRLIVDEISTAVTLTGSELDPNFAHYETCSAAVGPKDGCTTPPPPGCAFTTATSNLSQSLAPSQTTCVYARARDLAGNVSEASVKGIVSDLLPPDAPTVAPLYDPTIFTVQADYVDFFITAAAADEPAGTGPWGNVAWVEVDTGAGFEPLCPSATCRPDGVYSPCDARCACGDARRLCRGTEFAGVRMPLLGGTANRFSIRAVDVAGNVGSGATQLVNTVSTSQLVSTTSYDEAHPRTRFGLLTYVGAPVAGVGSFTGRLVALGQEKRYDPSDATCDLEPSWYGALYPSAEPVTATSVVFVGGTGRFLKVRRAGVDGAFCTGDDATTTLRDAGVDPLNIVAASGSLDKTGARERAAWAEGKTTAPRSIQVVVRESGANRLLDTVDDLNVTVAGPFTDLVTEISLGGDVLLYKRSNGIYTALTATSGSFAGPLISFTLPAGAIAAAIDTTGQLMAWVANDPAQTIHLLTAGFDGIFGTGDDVERTRTVLGAPQLFSGGVAVEAGHLVVAEGAVASGPSYLSHWYDGGDGNFGTADDLVTRILPSSRPRYSAALAGGVAAGTVYLQVGQSNTGENADLLAADLSARRWEVASDVALSMPRPNNAGTLFYRHPSGLVMTRTSDGRELPGPAASAFAASGSQFFAAVGSTLSLHAADTRGQWFSTLAPAPTTVATTLGNYGAIEAGDGYAVVQTSLPVSNAIHLLRNTGTPWTATRLDNTVAGFPEWVSTYGMTVSSRHVLWSCRVPGTYPEYACYRSAGPDGILGTGDDASGRVSEPGGTTPYGPVMAMRASGNKVLLVIFRAAAYHIVIVEPGADGLFSTGADNLETDLGAVTEAGGDNYDFRGSMVAWAQSVVGNPGTQVMVHDLRDGTRRQLTTHYSQKPEVRVEASGRVFWSDTLLQAQSIFLSSP